MYGRICILLTGLLTITEAKNTDLVLDLEIQADILLSTDHYL